MVSYSGILISVDGPDGCGKTSISKLLEKKLNRDNHYTTALLVKPTYFETTPEAMKIEVELKSAGELIRQYQREHNFYYLRAMRENYINRVLPYLLSNKIVILDSSEIRSLAFNIAMGCQEAVLDTEKRILSGYLTSGVIPDLRIVLTGEDEDLWKNLNSKPCLDTGDPKNIEMVRERKSAYKKAIMFVKKHENKKMNKWIKINICHKDRSLHTYFNSIIDTQIMQHLPE